jgi:UPF0716 protein FxsA
MFVLVLLICWPVAELYVAIQVAQAIGVLLTVVLLIAGWPLGMWLVRAEGRVAWRRLRAASATGRPPGREVLDGALILAGGSLFIVPGFITDFLGLLLLLPPTRALARTSLMRNLQSRLVRRATRSGGGPGRGPGPGGPSEPDGRSGPGGRSGQGRGSRPGDVDSTATEIESAQLPR